MKRKRDATKAPTRTKKQETIVQKWVYASRQYPDLLLRLDHLDKWVLGRFPQPVKRIRNDRKESRILNVISWVREEEKERPQKALLLCEEAEKAEERSQHRKKAQAKVKRNKNRYGGFTRQHVKPGCGLVLRSGRSGQFRLVRCRSEKDGMLLMHEIPDIVFMMRDGILCSEEWEADIAVTRLYFQLFRPNRIPILEMISIIGSYLHFHNFE